MENQNNDVFSDIVNNHRNQIQDDEVINFANKHHNENKVAPNLEAPKVTDFKIDYEGKEYQGASKESKKMDRRTFLKLLGATALAAMGYKMAKDKIGPGGCFSKFNARNTRFSRTNCRYGSKF